MSPARTDHHDRIVGNDIGPLERKSGELSRVVMEVDAVLTPTFAGNRLIETSGHAVDERDG